MLRAPPAAQPEPLYSSVTFVYGEDPPKASAASCVPKPPVKPLAVVKGAPLDHASVTSTLLKVPLVLLYQICPSHSLAGSLDKNFTCFPKISLYVDIINSLLPFVFQNLDQYIPLLQ